jgi:hypothetical protein
MLWDIPQEVGYAAAMGEFGEVVIVRTVFVAVPNPAPSLRYFEVAAFDEAGKWVWGFRHITGKWNGQILLSPVALSIRPGFMAFTSPYYDTAVYTTHWTAAVCDGNPLFQPPGIARACVFVPLVT